MPFLGIDAEIGRGEKFLQQDDLSALVSGFLHQALGAVEVFGEIPAAGHLGAGNGDVHDGFQCAA